MCSITMLNSMLDDFAKFSPSHYSVNSRYRHVSVQEEMFL